jgi:Tol biopolymer transport system component
MSISPGTRLGTYEVIGLLGAGGMGEVYRARDTKLQRDVALKVLPELFAADPDRRARFTREAHVLASLNHPQIGSIYGIEEAPSTSSGQAVVALVLELVEGPTLADRIAQGPIPIGEALRIAAQIADALDAAHEKGIIHRDLKPANIKLTADDRVKVLDFGLAKAMTDESSPNASLSPTMTAMASRLGVIVGTAAYMSPEQAKGKPVDKRADIWAFGCVLFEMLTGQRAFAGDDVTDFIVSIMTKEPPWTALPAATPPRIVELLHSCLTKDPRERLRDVGDARSALAARSPVHAVTHASASSSRMAWTVAAAAGVVALVAVVIAARPRPTPPAADRPAHFTVHLPPDSPAMLPSPDGTLAIAPDGSRFAYAAADPTRMLWDPDTSTLGLKLRELNDVAIRTLPGTEGAQAPSFSPDGQSIAYLALGTLKKVDIHGGPAMSLAESLGGGFGTAWDGDTIYFSGADGISSVPAGGGPARTLTRIDHAHGESFHCFPEPLTGGRALLYTVASNSLMSYDDAVIAVQRLDTGERRDLIKGGSQPRYLSSGHILYNRAGALMIVGFDPERLEVIGTPVRALVGGRMNAATGAASVAVSRNGTLIYAAGGPIAMDSIALALADRRGALAPLPTPRRLYVYPALSPDGTRLAVTARAALDDIWVYEFAHASLTRLTFTLGNNWMPVWTSDGAHIVFSSDRNGPFNLYWKRADGSGAEERLTTSAKTQFPTAVSSDGKWLAFTEVDAQRREDISMLSLADRGVTPFLQTPFRERHAAFSPDGKWVAYTSDESGRDEVFVRPFPSPGSRVAVSVDGGRSPRWGHDGRELFYRKDDALMRAPVTLGTTFTSGKSERLFTHPDLGARVGLDYDVTPDSSRFVVLEDKGLTTRTTTLEVVLNWFAELPRR